MGSHSVQQLVISMESMLRVAISLHGMQWLQRFQCLHRSFETDRSRFDVVFGCRLSHNGADQIVSENVCPDFLAH